MLYQLEFLSGPDHRFNNTIALGSKSSDSQG